MKVSNVSAEEVVHGARTLYDLWPELINDGKRKIAESIFEKFAVGDGAVDIDFNYLPTSEELCKSMQKAAHEVVKQQ